MSYISGRLLWLLPTFALAFACVFILSPVALAAPSSVNLRVEGSSSTLFEGKITTDTNKPDSLHACNGPSPTTALFDMAQSTGTAFAATWWDGLDYLIDKVGPDASGDFGSGFHWWSLWVNNKSSTVGGCQVTLTGSDTALWAYVKSETSVLGLEGPATIKVGEPFKVEVKKYDEAGSASPAQGASLAVDGRSYTAGADGKTEVTITAGGNHSMKAELSGSVRSNALSTCAYTDNSGLCDTLLVEALGDRTAPTVRVLWPKKKRYRRGPSLIKGYVERDPSGIREVKFRLTRKKGKRGRLCRGFNFKRERFNKSCKKAAYKKVGDSSSWSYQLPSKLKPGLYMVEARATDRAGNTSRPVFGRSRVYFRVLNKR